MRYGFGLVPGYAERSDGVADEFSVCTAFMMGAAKIVSGIRPMQASIMPTTWPVFLLMTGAPACDCRGTSLSSLIVIFWAVHWRGGVLGFRKRPTIASTDRLHPEGLFTLHAVK